MGNHDGYLYLSVTAGSDQETEIKRFMYRGYMAFTEMEELNVKLMGIKSHNIISHPLLDAPLVSSTGGGHSFATLSSNTLLKHSFKQSDMTQIRALEGTKKSMMVENLPQQCMEMLTQHLTQHYTTEGGKDDPQGYTNFMLRLMQRPFLLYDPEMFSENVQTEVSTLASLQFTNLPEAGALLDVNVNYPGSDAHSVENDFSTQVTGGLLPDLVVTAVMPSIRDICSLTEETTSSTDLKNIIKNIKGDASVAAVKVYKGTKDASGNPQWSACGYLKLPEQVSLHFKKLHAEDVDDHVLMLDH